jgi:hypothetical protein
MRKNLLGLLKGLVCLVSININVSGHAQSTSSITSNEIVVSVTGIAYEDPALSLLKESLKNNKKVKSTKNSFDKETAKITLSCSGTATDLWDEVPKTTKDFFKLTSIDDKHIALQYKNASQSNTAPNTINTTTTSNTNNKNDDCKNCYFNLCKYDGIKTFQGVVYKQINYDEGTYYYNCDNGVLVRKIIYKNGYGQTTNITNDTILMSNVPIGTKWSVKSDASSFLISSKSYSDYTLFRKGISIQVNGVTYNDVIVVYYRQYSKDNLIGESSSSANYYYAKGVGLIKTENLGAISDPTYSPTGNNTGKNDNEVSDALYKTMKGKIDETITGAWKYHDKEMNWDIYYVFNSDGTYQYYVGSINPANQMPSGKCYWRVDGGWLELLAEGWNKVYRFEIQKKNDAATGKPTLVIQFKDTEYRTYFSEDGKTPWK